MKLCGIFEITVFLYVFANKACQSETKIENKYRQCTIYILKIWYSFSDQYIIDYYGREQHYWI